MSFEFTTTRGAVLCPLELIVMWFYIDEKWPPFVVHSAESGIEQETITHDVVAVTEDHGEVVTYHDGDVWCYPHLSGCPQYRVIKWRPLAEGESLIYDGIHCRVAT